MLITSTAVQRWRDCGLSMLDTKDSLAEISLSQQCLMTSHPSQRAKQKQVDEHQRRIVGLTHDRFYKQGLDLIDNDLFDTELTERQKENWKEGHSTVMDCEKRINDIQRFFQNSDNILGHVRGASGFRLKKIHTLDGTDHPTKLDWALIKVDVEKWQPSNKVTNLPTLSQYFKIGFFDD